jgi:hypothetical protein
LNRIAFLGVVLGLVGAFLDFSSGYFFLTQSMVSSIDMGVITNTYNSSALAWGIGIFAFGLVLVITALPIISRTNMTRMPLIGTLMIFYGIAMLFIGASMFSGFAPLLMSTELSFLLSFGMFAIGILMVMNGVMMLGFRHNATM